MEDLGKLIIAKGFKKLPKVQNIAQSGHTEQDSLTPLHNKARTGPRSAGRFWPEVNQQSVQSKNINVFSIERESYR